MIAVALLFIVSVIAELLLHSPVCRQKLLRYIGILLSLASMVAAVLVAVPGSWTVAGTLFVVLYIYRAVNIMRIRAGRMHHRYLQLATLRTSVVLIAAQAVLGGLSVYESSAALPYGMLAGVVLIAELVLVAVVVATGFHRLRHGMRLRQWPVVVSSKLPSVSVLIPARNESDDLQACLTTLLAADYPKLEIIVLDDCSQGSRTSDVVRSFSHAGVRFIQGTEPGATWLAKNHAYQSLAEAASADLLLFAGVDIRFEPDAIRRIVSTLPDTESAMVSIMPQNTLHPRFMPLLQPMRYAIQLLIPRALLRSRPVLGSCWLLTRQAFTSTGGFSAVSRMVEPEIHFARHAGRYDFIIGGAEYGVHSAKQMGGQRDTAIRTAYPRLHKRPEAVALLSLIVVLGTGLPVAFIVTAVLTGSYLALAAVAILILSMMTLGYGLVLLATYGRIRPLDMAGLLPALLAQVSVLHYSMYKYEFDEVIWKGRNVCIPAMHVVPKLPDF